jgi:hypothetical protein
LLKPKPKHSIKSSNLKRPKPFTWKPSPSWRMPMTNYHDYPLPDFNQLLTMGVDKYVVIGPTCGQTMNIIFVSPSFISFPKALKRLLGHNIRLPLKRHSSRWETIKQKYYSNPR